MENNNNYNTYQYFPLSPSYDFDLLNFEKKRGRPLKVSRKGKGGRPKKNDKWLDHEERKNEHAIS